MNHCVGKEELGATGRKVQRAPEAVLEVNGARHTLEPETTVAALVRGWCTSEEGIAVARNGEVVPRSQWGSVKLSAGDRVEILTAAAGG